jgi:NADH-quinone oxidoreductase subunit G
MFALKALLTQLGVKNMDCRQDGTALDPKNGRASYIFNSSLEGIEEADAILLVGCNPRLEAAVLNARLRKHWIHSDVKIGVIGEQADLTYDYEYIGAGPESLTELFDNKSAAFRKVLDKAKKPMIIVGQGALTRTDGKAVLAASAKLAQTVGAVNADWNGFNVLHTAASRVGGLDLGFVPASGGMNTESMMKAARAGDLSVLILLGADEIDLSDVKDCTVIYIGTHGDRGAHGADIILPSAAYTEKNGIYVNTEGRVQHGARGVFPPGLAKEEWAIFRALSSVLGEALPFDSFAQLRSSLFAAYPHFAHDGEITMADAGAVAKLSEGSVKMNKAPFQSPVTDYYMTNPIARASKIMADCSANKQALKGEATGTNG